MSNFHSSKSVILKNVRLTWMDIFTPGEGMNDGPPKFKVSAIMEPGSEAFKVGKEAMLEAAKGLWGGNAISVVKSMAKNSKALRNGNDKLNDDGSIRAEYADMMFISCSNKMKPQIVGPKRINGAFVDILENGGCSIQGRVVEPPYPITVPYRGCYVNLKVQMVAGKAFKGSKGELVPNQVYAKLEAVQFVKEGIAFGSGPNSADGFDDEDVPESTSGDNDDLMDDDIPF